MERLLSAEAALIGRRVYLARQVPAASLPGARADHLGRRNRSGERCIVKSIRGHWRLRNEADVLKHYQSGTLFLRPLVDEIRGPADPPSIVLRYLDGDVLTESNKKRLSPPEIKKVARCVLEALRVLHRDGMVHTDVKLDNVFINHGGDGQRFSDASSATAEALYPSGPRSREKGTLSVLASPAALRLRSSCPGCTATDIWSFGTAMLSLWFGGGYHLFNPKVEMVDPEDDAYELTVLKRMHKFFGPYPQSYNDFNDLGTMTIINFINRQGPPAKPFARAGPMEILPADKEFILQIMKLDPRDRPAAEELLADVWFTEKSPDTREPPSR
ncbi:Serine/threonine protein kinase [Madurella fahalii]|uniref:Serine/threonine protein kinase n=1 Tax=Madurella fahalii TaxID=1157608 RepID=A0ABQ0G3R3_9PEZI